MEAKTAKTLIKEYIESNLVFQADKSTTFFYLSECIDVHIREISGTDKGKFNLRWVHIAISNLKKHLQTNHIISERMMQNYLDEFCYRLNPRYFVKNFLTDSSLLQFTHTGKISDNYYV